MLRQWAAAAGLGYASARSALSTSAAQSEGKDGEPPTGTSGFLGTRLEDERQGPRSRQQHLDGSNQGPEEAAQATDGDEDQHFGRSFVFNAVEGQDPLITLGLYTIGGVFVAWRVKNMLKNVSAAYRARGGSSASSSSSSGSSSSSSSKGGLRSESAAARQHKSEPPHSGRNNANGRKKQQRKSTQRKQPKKGRNDR